MAVCGAGRFYATGTVFGNLCKYGFPGTFCLWELFCIPGPAIWKKETGVSKTRSCWLLAWQSARCPTIIYGWILCSFLFFCLTVLLCREEPVKQRIAFLFRRGIVIAAVTLVLCGWWFVRNAILYDGDFIGRKACAECAEKYAAMITGRPDIQHRRN